MKIANVELLVVPDEGRGLLLVVVETDEGLYGLGEVGIRNRPLATRGAVDHLRDLVTGVDPSRIEHLWQLMHRGGFFPADRLFAAAAAAVDAALWDIRGKAAGLPLYELLGGRTRDYVACYAHLHGGEAPRIVDHARQLVDAGWRYVRFSVGGRTDPVFEPREALRHTLAVTEDLRNALGDDVEILIDAHTRLDPADAVVFCREVEKYRPYFVEDPLRCENLDSYRMLRQRTGVPIAAGEQLATKWDFQPLLEGELVDHARVDVAITGVTEARKIAAMAEAHYIDLVTHNPLGPVCTAVSTHLNTAVPNVRVQEQRRPTDGGPVDLFTATLPVRDGRVVPSDAPGHGVDIDLAAARNAGADLPEGPPRYHRRDGSFTNW